MSYTLDTGIETNEQLKQLSWNWLETTVLRKSSQSTEWFYINCQGMEKKKNPKHL